MVDLWNGIQEQNGVYRWNFEIEKTYERRSYQTAMKACLIVAACVFGFGVVFTFMTQDLMILGIMSVCVAVYLLIALIICRMFDRLDPGPHMSYELTDTCVKAGAGRSAVTFRFRKTRKAVVRKEYIELKGALSSLRVYAPADIMPVVRTHILNRIPGKADIRFE